jgi:transposase
VKGRKRHILVDTTGMILQVLVHEADIQDHAGGKLLLEPLGGCFPRLKLIWVDRAYKKGGFIEWVKETFGWEVEAVEHPWTGQRGVWAPKDTVIDPEQVRASRLPRVAHGAGLWKEPSPGSPPGVDSPRTMSYSPAVKKPGSALP